LFNRLSATFYKEFLVLTRDRAGLALLFIMPVVLITMMALIQDAPFKDYQELKFELLLIDQDHSSVSKDIKEGLDSTDRFTIVQNYDGKLLDEAKARDLVKKGKYPFCIILPKGCGAQVQRKSKHTVAKLLAGLGMPVEDTIAISKSADLEVQVLFDPAAKKAFKSAVMNAIDKMLARIESKAIMQSLSTQLSSEDNKAEAPGLEELNFINTKEVNADPDKMTLDIVSNSVQHNVPAWTIFAMFFIVIPLGGAILKEREDGSLLRMKLMPGSYMMLLLGKVLFYVLVCVLQFFLMMPVGMYLLPMLGLPALNVGDHWGTLACIAVSLGYAATCYGILIGSIFKTPSQSLTFGSISVVLLSALGGIWIPIYIMPPVMQKLSALSPLGWGLEAVNDLFLRNLDFIHILPQLIKLLSFGTLALTIAWLSDRKGRK